MEISFLKFKEKTKLIHNIENNNVLDINEKDAIKIAKKYSSINSNKDDFFVV